MHIFKLLSFIFLLVSFLNADTITRTKVAMGTFVSISTQARSSHLIEHGFSIFKAVESSLSSYDPNAKIYKLNQNKHILIDNYTYESLKLSQKYYEKTDGYFDITIGSITKKLYQFGEKERIPSVHELSNANVNFKSLRFNTKEAFLDGNSTIDLGGMGKGYGVDKVVEYLKKENVTKIVVAASGDIRCIGQCNVQIQDPYSDAIFGSFTTLKDEMGISTSGNYNRYVQSTKNNHLINPKLKKSAQNFVSITLISEIKNSNLDAYATAVSVMPTEKAYSFLDAMSLAYIIIESDGKLVISKNISEFVKDLKIN